MNSKNQDDLENILQEHIENLRGLGVVVNDFQSQNQKTLDAKLQMIISHTKELDSLLTRQKNQNLNSNQDKNSILNTKVPLEVLGYIDAGKSPQLFTRDVVQQTFKRNVKVNGQIKTLTKFREELISSLSSYSIS